ncbi:ComC/BlpC family leader-containing pheromone/bacteriocin [Williamwhitmania taraxaci]|uniref:COMC family protein n=1 Tax=Williamwhitmania taraxaci TaxID=1640674 RepID=A0A1G6S0E6_9BACT|nr:ComC/BlpC family leader-containing pheromone/bacteriocin [Williamwhitmania taraxaci]SDD10143.1 COMC family protein [Williamwhitmania taraxaci]
MEKLNALKFDALTTAEMNQIAGGTWRADFSESYPLGDGGVMSYTIFRRYILGFATDQYQEARDFC